MWMEAGRQLGMQAGRMYVTAMWPICGWMGDHVQVRAGVIILEAGAQVGMQGREDVRDCRVAHLRLSGRRTMRRCNGRCLCFLASTSWRLLSSLACLRHYIRAVLTLVSGVLQGLIRARLGPFEAGG